MLSVDDEKLENCYCIIHEQLFELAAKNALPENIIDQLINKNEN